MPKEKTKPPRKKQKAYEAKKILADIPWDSPESLAQKAYDIIIEQYWNGETSDETKKILADIFRAVDRWARLDE